VRAWLVALAVVAGSWTAAGGQADPPQTIRALLAREHVESTGLSLLQDLPLDRAITDYAVTNTPQVFAVAYYWKNLMEGIWLPDRFEVLLLDKAATRWAHTTLVGDRLPRTAQTPEGVSVGTIVGVSHTPRHLLVQSHLTPSASSTLVLTLGLEPTALFYGWPLFTLPSGAIAYYRSQPHFAPTHQFELYVFDPSSGAERMVYPLKPYDPPRRAFIEQMRVAYTDAGEAWCRDRNHHCNPEWFDSHFGGTWAVDAARSSMAFVATFGNPPGARGDSPDDAVTAVEVAVVCRHSESVSRIACRETRLETLRKDHPGLGTADLLRVAIAAPPR
jgi:hypothetical protein